MADRWLWAGFVAAGGLLTATALALPGTAVADVVWVGGGLLSGAALAAGALVHKPTTPWVWYSLSAGITAWVVSGGLVAALPPDAPSRTSLPALANLAAVALVSAGLLGFTQRHTQDRVLPTLDAMIVTVAAAMMMWIFVALPAWTAGQGPERWFDAAQPFGFALLFGVFYRLTYTAGGGRVAAKGITAVLGATILYQSAARPLDLAVLDNRPLTTAVYWLAA